jgi:hypothetical protein
MIRRAIWPGAFKEYLGVECAVVEISGKELAGPVRLGKYCHTLNPQSFIRVRRSN